MSSLPAVAVAAIINDPISPRFNFFVKKLFLYLLSLQEAYRLGSFVRFFFKCHLGEQFFNSLFNFCVCHNY